MFDYLSDWCLKEEKVRSSYGVDNLQDSTNNAKYVFKQDAYTNNWHEWVGIDPLKTRTPEGGCIFELDVETQLGRPPRVGFLSIEWCST